MKKNLAPKLAFLISPDQLSLWRFFGYELKTGAKVVKLSLHARDDYKQEEWYLVRRYRTMSHEEANLKWKELKAAGWKVH